MAGLQKTGASALLLGPHMLPMVIHAGPRSSSEASVKQTLCSTTGIIAMGAGNAYLTVIQLWFEAWHQPGCTPCYPY